MPDYESALPFDPRVKAGERPSLFDFIPGAYREDIRAGTITVDLTGWIQDAIASVASAGGGYLYVPYGLYPIGDLDLYNFVSLKGDGMGKSHFIRNAALPPGRAMFNIAGSFSGLCELSLDGQITTPVGMAYSSLSDPMADSLTENSSIWIQGGATDIEIREVRVFHSGGRAAILDARTASIKRVKFAGCVLENNRPHLFGPTVGEAIYGSWTGGIHLQGDGISHAVHDLSVSDCTFRRGTGNQVHGHVYGFGALHSDVRITNSTFTDIGRDGVLMGAISGGVVSGNSFRRIGYICTDDTSPGVPRWISGQWAVALDTAGLVRGVNYVNNSFLNCLGAAIDGDGLAECMVAGNTVRVSYPDEPEYLEDSVSSWPVDPDRPLATYCYGIQTSNSNNIPHASRGVSVVGNVFKNLGLGAIRLFAARKCDAHANTIWSPDAPIVAPIVMGPIGAGPNQRAADNAVYDNTIHYNPAAAEPCVFEDATLSVFTVHRKPGYEAPQLFEEAEPRAFDPSERNWVAGNRIFGVNAYEFKKDSGSSSITGTMFSSQKSGLAAKSTNFLQREDGYLRLYGGEDALFTLLDRHAISDIGTGVTGGPLFNVSLNGVGGAITTNGRTVLPIDDCVATGVLAADNFLSLTYTAPFNDAKANLFDANIGLMRYNPTTKKFQISSAVTGTPAVRVWADLATGVPVVPGAPIGSVQYNKASAFTGDANLKWDDALKRLSIIGAGLTGTPPSMTTALYVTEGYVEATVGFLSMNTETTTLNVPVGGITAKALISIRNDAGAGLVLGRTTTTDPTTGIPTGVLSADYRFRVDAGNNLILRDQIAVSDRMKLQTDGLFLFGDVLDTGGTQSVSFDQAGNITATSAVEGKTFLATDVTNPPLYNVIQTLKGGIYSAAQLTADQALYLKSYAAITTSPPPTIPYVPGTGYGGLAHKGGTQYWVHNGTAWVAVDLAAIGAGAPGGVSGNAQYNNGVGGLAGNANFHWDTVNQRLQLKAVGPLNEALRVLDGFINSSSGFYTGSDKSNAIHAEFGGVTAVSLISIRNDQSNGLTLARTTATAQQWGFSVSETGFLFLKDDTLAEDRLCVRPGKTIQFNAGDITFSGTGNIAANGTATVNVLRAVAAASDVAIEAPNGGGTAMSWTSARNDAAACFTLKRTAATAREYSWSINASGFVVLRDVTASNAPRFFIDPTGLATMGVALAIALTVPNGAINTLALRANQAVYFKSFADSAGLTGLPDSTWGGLAHKAGTQFWINNGAGWVTVDFSTVGGGVTSITGTANQVIADRATGAVKLSLPQSIALTSDVTFNSLLVGDKVSFYNIAGELNNKFNILAYLGGFYFTAESTAGASMGTSLVFRNGMAGAGYSERLRIIPNGTVIIGAGPDSDGSGAVLQVTGAVSASVAFNVVTGAADDAIQAKLGGVWAKKVTADMALYMKSTPVSASLNNPTGYGGFAHKTGTEYWLWNGTTWVTINLATVGGGVTSITGTPNRVLVNQSTGAVTLNLPQDFHTAANVQFNKVTVADNVTFANQAGSINNQFSILAYQSGLYINAFSNPGADMGTLIIFRTAQTGAGYSERLRIIANGTVIIGNGPDNDGSGALLQVVAKISAGLGFYSGFAHYAALEASAGGVYTRSGHFAKYVHVSGNNGVPAATTGTPGVAENGWFYYDTGLNKFRAYENSVWKDMIGAGGVPGAPVNSVQFNSGVNTFAGSSEFLWDTGQAKLQLGPLVHAGGRLTATGNVYLGGYVGNYDYLCVYNTTHYETRLQSCIDAKTIEFLTGDTTYGVDSQFILRLQPLRGRVAIGATDHSAAGAILSLHGNFEFWNKSNVMGMRYVAFAGQTVNHAEWQTSTGVAKAAIDPNFNVVAEGFGAKAMDATGGGSVDAGKYNGRNIRFALFAAVPGVSPADHIDSGRISYGVLNADALTIMGKGPTLATQKIRLNMDVVVGNDLYANGAVGAGGAMGAKSLNILSDDADSQVYVAHRSPRIGLGNHADYSLHTLGVRLVLCTQTGDYGLQNGEAYLFTVGAPAASAGPLYIGVSPAKTIKVTLNHVLIAGAADPLIPAMTITGGHLKCDVGLSVPNSLYNVIQTTGGVVARMMTFKGPTNPGVSATGEAVIYCNGTQLLASVNTGGFKDLLNVPLPTDPVFTSVGASTYRNGAGQVVIDSARNFTGGGVTCSSLSCSGFGSFSGGASVTGSLSVSTGITTDGGVGAAGFNPKYLSTQYNGQNMDIDFPAPVTITLRPSNTTTTTSRLIVRGGVVASWT